ncbi:hypothetical protein CsatA_022992 [Cannabis sativa]
MDFFLHLLQRIRTQKFPHHQPPVIENFTVGEIVSLDFNAEIDSLIASASRLRKGSDKLPQPDRATISLTSSLSISGMLFLHL